MRVEIDADGVERYYDGDVVQMWPTNFYDLFRQATWWPAENKAWVRIATLDDRYARNLIHFLEVRAVAYHLKVSEAIFDIPSAWEDGPDDLWGADPMTWLRGTPLHKAIAAQVGPTFSSFTIPEPIEWTD